MPPSGEILTAPVLERPAAEGMTDERRTAGDRRHDVEPGRRTTPKPASRRRLYALLGDVAAIVVLLAAIIVAVDHAKPIFAGQPTVVQSLAQRVPATKPLLIPQKDTGRLAALLASPQFAADSAAFAADLVRTGRMSQDRADSIAYYALREGS